MFFVDLFCDYALFLSASHGSGAWENMIRVCSALFLVFSVVSSLNFGSDKRNLYDFVSVALDGTVAITTPTTTVHLPLNFTDVKHICSTGWAWAFLKTDNSVFAYGDSTYGGEIPNALNNIHDIKSTKFAFAAISYDGTIYAWGHPDHGGSMHNLASTGYTSLYSTEYFFAATTPTTLVHWGDDESTGLTSVTALQSPVKKVVGSAKSITALLANNHFVFVGDKNAGVPPPTSLSIASVAGTSSAYALLSDHGTVSAWGEKIYGGDIASAPSALYTASAIVSNRKAFAAISGDEIITWGDAKCGGNRVIHLPNTIAVFSSECSFAALSRSGNAIIWGFLHNQPVLHRTSNIHWIYSTKHTYLLLSTFNTAYTIGEMDHKMAVNSASMIAVTDHRIAVLTNGKLSVMTRDSSTTLERDMLTVFGHEMYLPTDPSIVKEQPRSYYVTSNNEFSFNWVTMS